MFVTLRKECGLKLSTPELKKEIIVYSVPLFFVRPPSGIMPKATASSLTTRNRHGRSFQKRSVFIQETDSRDAPHDIFRQNKRQSTLNSLLASIQRIS